MTIRSVLINGVYVNPCLNCGETPPHLPSQRWPDCCWECVNPSCECGHCWSQHDPDGRVITDVWGACETFTPPAPEGADYARFYRKEFKPGCTLDAARAEIRRVVAERMVCGVPDCPSPAVSGAVHICAAHRRDGWRHPSKVTRGRCHFWASGYLLAPDVELLPCWATDMDDWRENAAWWAARGEPWVAEP